MSALNFAMVKRICLVMLFGMLGLSVAHAADEIEGKRYYEVHCAACHGSDGFSIMIDAPNFARSERLLRPDSFVRDAIKDGGGAMPSYQGILSDQEILDVIAHMRTLIISGPILP
jgi:cytochrome c6